MFIKYVLIAILILLAASILYDGIKRYLAQRKEKKTLRSTHADSGQASDRDDHQPKNSP